MHNRPGLRHRAEYRARCQLLSGFQLRVRLERPFAVARQGEDIDAALDVVAGALGQLLERPLHAVEDTAHQARTEFHREGPAEPGHGFARAHALGRFVGLHHRLVATQRDHLPEQTQFAEPDLLPVLDARQPDGDDGPVDIADCPLAFLFTHAVDPLFEPAVSREVSKSCSRMTCWMRGCRRARRPRRCD